METLLAVLGETCCDGDETWVSCIQSTCSSTLRPYLWPLLHCSLCEIAPVVSTDSSCKNCIAPYSVSANLFSWDAWPAGLSRLFLILVPCLTCLYSLEFIWWHIFSFLFTLWHGPDSGSSFRMSFLPHSPFISLLGLSDLSHIHLSSFAICPL